MNMQTLDWVILTGALMVLLVICWWASRLTKSVADFLAANRLAGRYLLAVGQGMAGLGAITIAANFEKFYQAGFGATWWVQLVIPIGLIITLSGFVIYRYRETRAMTMAQFFEMRYSKRFRVFAGVLAWSSGILNYGIFPAVSARFLIYFTGLPQQVELVGFSVPTVALVMLLLLTVAVLMAVLGGQISIMVTDMVQGQFVILVMLIILTILFFHMSWSDVIAGLHQSPEGQSKINPFDQGNLPDFNIWYFLMMGVLNVYGTRAWQGSQGYNAAARTPHEARMAGILGDFRGMITSLAIVMVPIYVFAYLHLPQFAGDATLIHDQLDQIANPQIQKQMLVPVALGAILPAGIMGLFAAVVILAAVSTDNTYLHSWGSIFIQDVLQPLRKKPLSSRWHMWALRLSIIGVAVFAFIWGMVFPMHEYIYMYFQITGAIYMGGAGAVIIGGLYWKRGTAGGAWAAMICGSVVAVGGIFVRNIFWPYLLPRFRESDAWSEFLLGLPEKFPLNGMQMSFIAAVVAILAYVICSLLSRRPPADMDRLLHRGKYAVKADVASGAVPAPLDQPRPRRTLAQRLGIGPEFTRGDKIIYVLKLTWAMFFVLVFAVGTIIHLFVPIPDSVWEKWWGFKVGLTYCVGIITVIWFLWGGFRDLGIMARALRSLQRDESDDGTVSDDEHVQKESGA
ncbi:sodium:solute symporter [Ruficoccus amylovorans]|uniref:Sodium:solute symporter n=1 Tax=Ruficoccus amylovorans TaxID=1804625 RepID=A0A842H8M7_9BACT|nr:sodium:solute symporter [Ruficoccus amylovorans]MBC2592883.1 sodium:solute symporter [Ruficoccus amylovorans]